MKLMFCSSSLENHVKIVIVKIMLESIGVKSYEEHYFHKNSYLVLVSDDSKFRKMFSDLLGWEPAPFEDCLRNGYPTGKPIKYCIPKTLFKNLQLKTRQEKFKKFI